MAMGGSVEYNKTGDVEGGVIGDESLGDLVSVRGQRV